MKNWWYYHKWYVICGVIVLGVIIHLLGNGLGLFKKTPDIQIAYIGTTALPDDTVTALEDAFAACAGDYNQDGEIRIQINQFVSGSPNETDADAMARKEAAMITLMGDINDCESYFFLMEDAEAVQQEFQVLAKPDGSCPDDTDFSAEGKVFRWSDCPLLSEMSLGSYRITLLGEETAGSNQELLAPLYLGRRCFYDDRRCDHADDCSQLWDQLQGGINQ